MNKYKNEKGITLVTLVVTVIVLLIIVSIGAYEGKNIIEKANIQTLETNMLSIKTKAKEYAENVDAEVWVYEGEEKINKTKEAFAKYNMEQTTIENENIQEQITIQNIVAYKVSMETLKLMGVEDNIEEDLEYGEYLIVYDAENYSNLDIIYTGGIKYEGQMYYTLSGLQGVF